MKSIIDRNLYIKEKTFNVVESGYGFLEMVDKTAYYLKSDSLIDNYVLFVDKGDSIEN